VEKRQPKEAMNAQGSHYFFSLKSGLLLTRTYATKLPMHDEAIARVHALARRQRAQLGLLFGDRLQRHAPLPIDLNVVTPPNVDRLDVAGGLNPGLSEPGN
jgi:hypothetical protein